MSHELYEMYFAAGVRGWIVSTPYIPNLYSRKYDAVARNGFILNLGFVNETRFGGRQDTN